MELAAWRRSIPGQELAHLGRARPAELEPYHSYLEVDLGASARNVERVRRHIGP